MRYPRLSVSELILSPFHLARHKLRILYWSIRGIWLRNVEGADLKAVEAFLVGNDVHRSEIFLILYRSGFEQDDIVKYYLLQIGKKEFPIHITLENGLTLLIEEDEESSFVRMPGGNIVRMSD